MSNTRERILGKTRRRGVAPHATVPANLNVE